MSSLPSVLLDETVRGDDEVTPEPAVPPTTSDSVQIAWRQPEILNIIAQVMGDVSQGDVHMPCRPNADLLNLMRVNKACFDASATRIYERELEIVTWDYENQYYQSMWDYLKAARATESRIVYYQSKVKIPGKVYCSGVYWEGDESSDIPAQVQEVLSLFPACTEMTLQFNGHIRVTLFRSATSGRWMHMRISERSQTREELELGLKTGQHLHGEITKLLGTDTISCPLTTLVAHLTIDPDEPRFWSLTTPPGSYHSLLRFIELGHPVDYKTLKSALEGMPFLTNAVISCNAKSEGEAGHPPNLDYIGKSCPLLETLHITFFQMGYGRESQDSDDTDNNDFQLEWGNPIAFPFLKCIDSLLTLCPRLTELRLPIYLPETTITDGTDDPHCEGIDVCCCERHFSGCLPARWPRLEWLVIDYVPPPSDGPHHLPSSPGFGRFLARCMVPEVDKSDSLFGRLDIRCEHDLAGQAVAEGHVWAREVEERWEEIIVRDQQESDESEREMDGALVFAASTIAVGWRHEGLFVEHTKDGRSSQAI